MNTTMVIGASDNRERYSNMAVRLLQKHNIPVVAIGLKNALINDQEIIKKEEFNFDQVIDTITMYLGPDRQNEYYDFIKKVNPKRVIFNPGTENNELIDILESKEIECIEACTLVMLNTGQW